MKTHPNEYFYLALKKLKFPEVKHFISKVECFQKLRMLFFFNFRQNINDDYGQMSGFKNSLIPKISRHKNLNNT